ncbi:L-threonylcarbamoyladenylate synthase [Thermodesulfobium sp. 4217-1]|uniref:L-threonylcarbamoyladenylate synthase n=1 Tax=Thermodesulfobium sp. 4217-1 TaxID=3120013 RepID=UPI003221BA63
MKKSFNNESVADKIKDCKIGIVPTDTLFALTGDARSEEVSARIFDVKKRLPDKSFPVFVPSLTWLLENGNFNYTDKNIFLRLASTFWPGPLTIVSRLFFNFNFSERVACDGFVALRVVSHPVIMKIFEEVNFPIIGTSANISGKINPLSIDDIDKTLLKQIDFSIKGDLVYLASSTVVKIEKGLEVLRDGVIAKDVVRRVLLKK